MSDTTLRAIDHLVLAVASLDEAARRYEALGFTLTPRAAHPDDMGTSNRLAQLAGGNFIELLEVDRPGSVADHDLAATPPRFSFGAHARRFVAERNGIAAIVLTGDDSRGDVEAFARAGLQTYAPFDFERRATLPDGTEVTVAFSLAYVTHPALPAIAFFTCHNRYPEHFWKPEFQQHPNRAEAIEAVYIAAPDPAAHGDFLGTLLGGQVSVTDGGIEVTAGSGHAIRVLEPERIDAIAPGTRIEPGSGPTVAGIGLRAGAGSARLTPASEACGIFIEWRP